MTRPRPEDHDDPADEGGDPACWAHLFEEDETAEDPAPEEPDEG